MALIPNPIAASRAFVPARNASIIKFIKTKNAIALDEPLLEPLREKDPSNNANPITILRARENKAQLNRAYLDGV